MPTAPWFITTTAIGSIRQKPGHNFHLQRNRLEIRLTFASISALLRPYCTFCILLLGKAFDGKKEDEEGSPCKKTHD